MYAGKAVFGCAKTARIPEKTLYHRRSSRTRLVTQYVGLSMDAANGLLIKNELKILTIEDK